MRRFHIVILAGLVVGMGLAGCCKGVEKKSEKDEVMMQKITGLYKKMAYLHGDKTTYDKKWQDKKGKDWHGKKGKEWHKTAYGACHRCDGIGRMICSDCDGFGNLKNKSNQVINCERCGGSNNSNRYREGKGFKPCVLCDGKGTFSPEKKK